MSGICNDPYYDLSHKLSIFRIISFAHCTAAAINLVGSQAALRPAEEIVRRSHVQARQNRRHNAVYALAALVHQGILQVSPYVRQTLVQIDLP